LKHGNVLGLEITLVRFLAYVRRVVYALAIEEVVALAGGVCALA